MEDRLVPASAEEAADRSRLPEAFDVLVKAVAQLTEGDHAPTASAVRLALKRLTYDGFDHRELGFKRFRDFLEAANLEGHIELHDRPGDVVVSLRGAVPSRRVRIRRDIWKAALNWSPREEHYLDLEHDKVLTLPSRTVPLEPERFRLLRERIARGDEVLVRIPTVDIHTQLRWMEGFAKSLDDPGLSVLLEGALGGDKPARLFTTVLRNEPGAQEFWYETLSANVLAHLQGWKEQEPRIAHIEFEARSTTGMRGNEAPEVGTGRSLVDAAGLIVRRVSAGNQPPNSRSARNQGTSEERLRVLLHRAIDRMPEEELRLLRLPVGFLLED